MGISIPHEDGPGQKRLGGTVSGSVQSTETFPARTARTSLTGLCSATSGVEVLLVGKNAFRYSSYVACGVVVAVEEATFAASTRRTDVTSTGKRNASLFEMDMMTPPVRTKPVPFWKRYPLA